MQFFQFNNFSTLFKVLQFLGVFSFYQCHLVTEGKVVKKNYATTRKKEKEGLVIFRREGGDLASAVEAGL